MQISWLLTLVLLSSMAMAQNCKLYSDSDIIGPGVIGPDTTHHTSGSHSLSSEAANYCTYSDNGVAAEVCIVEQKLQAFGIRSESGGTIERSHQLNTAYPPVIQRVQGPSKVTTVAEFAVQGCGLLGCPAAALFNWPPFLVTGGSVIYKDTATFIDSCFQHTNIPPKQCNTSGVKNAVQQCGTPLMMDLSSAFGGIEDATDLDHLTDKEHGIVLKFKRRAGQDWATVKPEAIGWTVPGSYMAVLVRPNANGEYTIETSDNVFGNYSTCANQKLCRNGVEALRYYCDDPINGGNGDGVCDAKDLHFGNGDLRWQVGRTKLLTMKEAKVKFLNFDATEMKGRFRRQDRWGNVFAIRSSMQFEQRNPHITRFVWVWDVIPDQGNKVAR